MSSQFKLSQEEEQEKESKRIEVLDEIKKIYPTFKEVCKDFESILRSPPIEKILDYAYIETSKRHYMNKHGVVHGLTVTSNMLNLFKLINKGVIDSDYALDYKYKEEHVLLLLLIASYTHDAGRFYEDVPQIKHEEHISDALVWVQRKMDAGDILFPVGRERTSDILRRIKELCLCHEKKEETSGKVEMALLKLADALDCSKNRVYTEREHPDLKGDYSKRISTILLKDKHPERYFGCYYIDKPEMNWNDEENALDIVLPIGDHAAFLPIKIILNILKKCEESEKESVNALSQGIIRLYVEERKNNEEKYRIYPEKITRIRGAKILSCIHNVDIQNDGNTEIEQVFHMINEKEKAGVRAHTFKLGGYGRAKWDEDIKLRAFKLPDDFQVQIFETPETSPSKVEGEELKVDHKSVEHKFIEGEKITLHTWTVRFKEKDYDYSFYPGESIRFIRRCSWKEMIKVKKDEFAHTVITPTDRLVINVFFPKEIKKGDIIPYFEIQLEDHEPTTIYRTGITHAIYFDAKRKKNYIHVLCEKLRTNFSYSVMWELKS